MRHKEAELSEELQFHLEEEAEQLQTKGLPGEEARRAARREMGNLTLVRENTRAVWGWTIVEQIGQDVRYAFRTMAPTACSRSRDFVAGAGDRSQHGNLQFHGLDVAAIAARLRSAVAGRPELARKGHPKRFRNAEHERDHVRRSKGGKVCWDIPVPGVRALPEKQLRLLGRVRPFSVLAGAEGECEIKGRPSWPLAGTCRGTISAASVFAGSRPADYF